MISEMGKTCSLKQKNFTFIVAVWRIFVQPADRMRSRNETAGVCLDDVNCLSAYAGTIASKSCTTSSNNLGVSLQL